jgi:peptidoglycan/xylan/chitin deacetylase (PgdA/CDA1 family)
MRSASLTPVITVAVAIGIVITLLTVGFSPTHPATITATPAAHTSTNTPGPGIPAPRADIVIGEAQDGPGKRVALTFDDGPDPTWTPQVLDLLAEHHVKATFCLIGSNAKAYPDLVRRIVAEGHQLCDHTVNHDEQLPKKPAKTMRAEIVGGRQAILDAAPNAQVRYYRAPGGAFSKKGARPSVQQIAVDNGMQPLGWSLDTEDWTKPGTTAIVESVRKHIGDDDVVLMHDAGGERQQTVDALGQLLPWLSGQGYRFVFPA